MSFSSTLVVGGIGDPKVYLLSETNLVANGDFEVDATGWTDSNVSSARTADSTAPKGNYVLVVQDASASLGYTEDALGTQSGNLVVTGWIKSDESSDHNVQVSIVGSSTYNYVIKAYADKWTKFTCTTDNMNLTSGATTLRLYTSDTDTDQYTVRYDDVRVYATDTNAENEVITMTDAKDAIHPNLVKQYFTKVLDGQQTLIDGSIKEYVKGWRYNCELRYDYIPASLEQYFLEISEHPFVLFVPHADDLDSTANENSYVWSEYVRWNKDFDHEYFYGRYSGHQGIVPFTGIDLIQTKPRVIFSGTL